MSKSEFYDISNLLKTNAHYMMMIGTRSRGKSFQVKETALKDYCDGRGGLAILRRWDTDIKAGLIRDYFADMVVNASGVNLVYKYSNGKYDNIKYRAGEWFLYIHDNENNSDVEDPQPFAKAFAVNQAEHYKTMVLQDYSNIFFEEFISRKGYIINEFTEFTGLLSTIIRLRDNVRIFMAGNTINKSCPYFREMGLTKIDKMKPGDIDIYRYGDSALRVAVEMTDIASKAKPSDVYFAFDNPRLTMITGKKGVWEIAIYPHCPSEYDRKDVLLTYFVKWERNILQCEIVCLPNMVFTFVHPKTTPLRDESHDLIYQPEFDARSNFRRKIGQIVTAEEKQIEWFYDNDKVFFSDNETGEIMRNYLLWCGKDGGIKTV